MTEKIQPPSMNDIVRASLEKQAIEKGAAPEAAKEIAQKRFNELQNEIPPTGIV